MSKTDISPPRKGHFSPVPKIFLFLICYVFSHIVLMDVMTKTTMTKVLRIEASLSTRGSTWDEVPSTAIVYLTKALDDCKAIRLSHLLQTVPQNIDVWILHNHDTMTKDSDQVALNASIDHVRRLKHEHLLYNASQANKRIPVFDTAVSLASKSSFLRFVVQHPEYKHVWQIEDDVFFTGEWSHFFAHADTEADFVGAQIKRKGPWIHFQGRGCSMDQKYVRIYNESVPNSSLSGRIMCRDVLTWSSLWSIVRVSTRFAQLLLEDLESGALRGHHEAVVQGLLLGHTNLTFVELSPLEGSNSPGGWGRYKDRTKSSLDMYQPVKDNRIYHPLKCEAYTGEKIDRLKDIMMTYGWSNGTIE